MEAKGGRVTVSAKIRRYQGSDWERLGIICVKTGNSGHDATGKFTDDQLLPYIYTYPYVSYAPDLAWVVDINGEACGYVIGVDDVAAFASWWKEHWIPILRDRFPDTDHWFDAEKNLLEGALKPENMVLPLRAAYPAELHIDLLPEAQGIGMGRKLIETYAEALQERNVGALAIGVGARNTNALGFYEKLGFTIVSVQEKDGVPLGYTLSLDVASFLS